MTTYDVRLVPVILLMVLVVTAVAVTWVLRSRSRRAQRRGFEVRPPNDDPP